MLGDDGEMLVNDGEMLINDGIWSYTNLPTLTSISPSLTSISPSLSSISPSFYILPALAWSKPSSAYLTIIEKLHRLLWLNLIWVKNGLIQRKGTSYIYHVQLDDIFTDWERGSLQWPGILLCESVNPAGWAGDYPHILCHTRTVRDVFG